MKLIIETYGAKLSLDSGVLVIATDKKKEEISLLHLSSIHIQTNVRISSALIEACINSHIPIYFENDLNIKAMIWSPRYGSISKIRKKQALFSYSSLKYRLIKKLLIRKNQERIQWFKKITTRPEILKNLNDIIQINNRLEQAPQSDALIRSLEGNSSKIYFQIYNALIPKKYRFDKRTYRQSTDVLNVSLNYAYGILYNEVTKALIVAGLDPDLGFFHAAQYNKPSLSYDMIEPYRIWAEQAVFKTFKNKTFQNIETPVDNKGQLIKEAKHILIETMAQWMQTSKILWNKRVKTPQNHIQLDAYQVAQYILNYSENDLLKNICLSQKNESLYNNV